MGRHFSHVQTLGMSVGSSKLRAGAKFLVLSIIEKLHLSPLMKLTHFWIGLKNLCNPAIPRPNLGLPVNFAWR